MRPKQLLTKHWRWLWVLSCLVLLELVLQISLRPSQLYSRFHTAPIWNEWRNQVRFWEKYRHLAPAELQQSIGYDAQLGWDFDIGGNRMRSDQPVQPIAAPGVVRVVTLGDSYVYGIDLEQADTFTSILGNRYANLETVNMGVPGYGIDQAIRKYLLHGAPLQPDVVVLGIYLTDYERSALRFTFSPKPRYNLSTDGLTLGDRSSVATGFSAEPIQTPEVAMAQTETALQGRVYLVEAGRNLYRKFVHTNADRDSFFANNDLRVRALLHQLQAALTSQQQLIVLHFPAPEQFADPSPYRLELHRRLLRIYQQLGLDVINLKPAFEKTRSAAEVHANLYIQKGGGSVGHLNRHAQEEIAQLLYNRIQSADAG